MKLKNRNKRETTKEGKGINITKFIRAPSLSNFFLKTTIHISISVETQEKQITEKKKKYYFKVHVPITRKKEVNYSFNLICFIFACYGYLILQSSSID